MLLKLEREWRSRRKCSHHIDTISTAAVNIFGREYTFALMMMVWPWTAVAAAVLSQLLLESNREFLNVEYYKVGEKD